MLFSDNKKNTTVEVENIKHKLNVDDHPVEDLVNAPSELKEKSLEINTNKGKLVVTTSSAGTELKNVVLEVKSDKKEPETIKADDVDDPSKKVRVKCIWKQFDCGEVLSRTAVLDTVRKLQIKFQGNVSWFQDYAIAPITIIA